MAEESSVSRCLNVRVEISETSLADLKQFVTEKGGRLIVDDAQTSTADVPVFAPAASSVPRGIVIEDSEDEHIGGGPAINRAVPSTASIASTEATASPREIAKQITSLLSEKGIPQRLFTEKVLNRSQGSFSDYLSKPPEEMPKTHSRAVWFKLKEFLESQEQQQELLEMKRRLKSEAKAPREKKDAINPRKRFSDIEISALDNVYLTSKGKPSKAVIEATAKTLKLDERQVADWYNNHRRKERQGTYKPGEFSQPGEL